MGKGGRKHKANIERAMFFALRVINVNDRHVNAGELLRYMKQRKVRAAEAGIREAVGRRYLVLEGDDLVLTSLAFEHFTMTFTDDIARTTTESAA